MYNEIADRLEKLVNEYIDDSMEKGVLGDEEMEYFRKSYDDLIRQNLKDKGYYFHHSSFCKGYIQKRVSSSYTTSYNGRYGTGYILHRHDADGASRHIYNRHIVEYWIKE